MKKFVVVLSIVLMTFCLGGCSFISDYTASLASRMESDDDLFVLIETDKSNTLNVNNLNYWYLKDTGVVYVGYYLNLLADETWGAPVISPNGRYYTYNTETESVEEILNE